MGDKSKCVGCEQDFYNGKNPMGVQECWSLKTAKMVTRYRLGYWTAPTVPGAFQKMKAYHCRSEKGYVFYDQLPSFAKPAPASQRE